MKTRLILIMVPLIILALALAGGFTLLWRFFLFLAVVWLLSYFWPRLSIRGLASQVKKSAEYCQVGKHFEEEFTVFNRGRIPAPVIEVREDTDLPGYQNTAVFSLFPRSSHSWSTRVYCRRRGQYNFGTLTARVTDPLGLFSLSRHLGERQSIIVYPATLELPYFQALPRQEPGQSPRRWLTSEYSPNAARVREYTSGDSLRHIHWHTTAHVGKLMVKEFDPDRANYAFKDIWIVLDMHQASHLGRGDEAIDEYSVMVAASITKKYIDSGKRVGLLASGNRPYLFPPEAGGQHLRHILRALALIKATGNVSIDTLLASQTERFDAGSVVVVITSSDNLGVAVPLRRALDLGVIVIVILLDSLSFGGRTNATNTARSLIYSGIHVHVIRRGQDIARALDSRFISSRLQYVGDKL
jgi:uncharacterized protein (DUF58 family)